MSLYDANLKERLRLFQESQGMSQAQLGARFGISATSINKYFSEKLYEGSVPRMQQLFRDGLARENERALRAKDLFDSPAVEKIRALCTSLKNNGEIGAAYGDAGIGKTCGANAALLADLSALFLTMTIWTRSLGGMQALLYDQLVEPDPPKRYGLKIMTYIKQVLKDSGRIILIDQAHLLNFIGRQFVCDLNDETGVAILLIGNPSMFNDWRELPQQSRRLKQCEKITLYSRGDERTRANNVDCQAVAMLERHFPEGKAVLVERAKQLMTGDGALGSLETTLRRAAEIYARENLDCPIRAFDAAEKKQVRNLDI